MKFFREIFFVFTEAASIKADESKRSKSIKFGVSSIVCSIIAVVFAFLFGLLLENLSSDLVVLLQVVLAFSIALCVAGLLIASLVRVIAQLIINRKALSWIALVFFLAAAAVAIYFVLVSIDKVI